MAQQTGSISFEATNAFSSYAGGEYATKETATALQTAIEQNAEAITLRATKTEAQQMAQPNLSPWFSLQPIESDTEHWNINNGNTTFTPLEDGWVHLHNDNSSGTGAKRTDYQVMGSPSVTPGADYTWLFEYRNNNSTGNNQNYIVQSSERVQFWGNNVVKVLEGKSGGATTTLGPNQDFPPETDGVYVKRVLKKAEAATSSHLDRTGTLYLGCLVCYAYAGAVADYDLRVSVYEGEYTGPYKPYSGTQLYASQAQLKVANDQIDLRVEKSGVIAAINASTEAEGGSAVKISADKVQIDGTTTFTSGTTLADYVEGKAQDAADSVVVGGRNLLLDSDDRTKWRINNPTAYLLARIDLSENLVMGDTYTLQIWGTVGRSDKSGTAIFNAYWGGGSVPLGALTPNSARDYWTLTFTAPSGAHNDKNNAYIYIYNTAPIGASGTTYSSNIIKAKLERGNKATDWSPAPEDQTAYVDSSIDGIQVGGRNYILNSASISASGIGSASGSRKEYLPVNVGQSYMGIAAGTEVVISFDLYMTVNTANPILQVYNTNNKGPKAFSSVKTGGGSSPGALLNFTAAVGDVIDERVSVIGYINDRNSPTLTDNFLEFYSNYGSSNWFSVSNLKMEIGNRATDWSPAPDDVTSRTQRIYYRTSSSTAPTSQYMPTAWVTETGDKWAANSTTVANWTAKATKLTNGTTKYPYLFTCEQRQMGDGTLAYTTVLLDETTTVIDGGSIITNSIDANKLTVYDATIGKIKADAIDVSAIKIGDLDGASTVVSNAANGKSAYDRHTAYRGTCSTAAGTAAKVVACTGFALATGATVEVYCSTANTADVPTLNVNSTGAKAVWINGAVASASNPCKWLAGDTVTFTYDGTRFRASLPVEGYVTEGTGGGLMVHRKSDATTGVQITSNVDIMRNGTSVAMFGTDGNGNALSRIGAADSGHSEQTADSFTIYTLDSTDALIPAVKIQTSEDAQHSINSRIYLHSDQSTTYIDTENSVLGSYIWLCADNVTEGNYLFPAVGLKAHDHTGLAMVRLYKDENTDGFEFRVDANSVRFPSSSIESDALKNVPTTKITGTLDVDHIPNMNASKIISGVFAEEQIPDVATSKLYGTIADANLPTKGSAGTAGTSSATSGATLAVPYITTDAYGRVIAKGTHTHTIGSLAASAVTSGTFNAARIPNLNASKITAGTLNSARLPTVPVDKGGTGQTGVTTVTAVASFISVASGVTVSSVRVTVWGKLVHAYVVAKPDAAKTSAWVVGTVVDAYRPNATATGSPFYGGVDAARILTDGTMQITACGAVEVGVSFTYLLA